MAVAALPASASVSAWYLVPSLALIGVGVSVVWLVSIPLRNVAIIDVWWGLGFVVAAAYYAHTAAWSARACAVLALTALWGGRLAAYLWWRNHYQHTGEDSRYAKMRGKVGPAFWWKSLGSVFVPQAIAQWLVATPLLYAAHTDADASGSGSGARVAFDAAGVALFAVGWYFEVRADRELTAFKADPANAGQLLNTGLWSVCRHPNYFGSALIWWGLWAFALPIGWWTVVSPVVMTLVLRYVTGVTLLEHHSTRKKPGFDAYRANTPAFIPSPTKLMALFTASAQTTTSASKAQ